jgi:pseudouridine synthase
MRRMVAGRQDDGKQACYIGGMAKRRSRRSDFPAALRDASRGVRLNKFLADAGVGSRRACEQAIEERRVTVNAQPITAMPVWVDPQRDRVEVDGRRVGRRRRGRTYLMVHKPRNVVCTNRDPEGRKRVIDLVPHTQRLFCVGRLDYDSTGLVILTDDGELSQRLTHPRYGVPKTYHVTIRGRLEEEDVARLQGGIWLADKAGQSAKARASGVRLITRHHDRSQLAVTLREGRNREIRRMLARLGHPVKKLKRTAIGPVKLKGVAPRQWRELTRQEVAALRRAAKRSGGKSASRKRERT